MTADNPGPQQVPPQQQVPPYQPHPPYQPPYPPRSQQPAPPPVPNPATAKNWLGTSSLVLSLLGVVLWFTAIPGIVLGHLGMAAARRGEADNGGMSLAGVIVGYTAVVLGLIFWLLFTIALVGGIGFLISECGGDSPAAWCTDAGAA